MTNGNNLFARAPPRGHGQGRRALILCQSHGR
jgi:hypothetical protein